MTVTVNTGEPTLLALYQRELVVDPYPFYRELREHHPIFWDEPLGSWVISSYADIVALSRDTRLSEDRVTRVREHMSPNKREELRQLGDALSDMMLFNGAPRHGELRGMVKGAFSRSAIETARETIRAQTQSLLDRGAGRGELDIVADLSQPLTKTVIASLLGIPDGSRYLLDDWVSLLHEFFTQSTAQVPRLRSLRRVFEEMITNGPGERLLAHMLSCCPDRSRRSRDLMFANFVLVIDAGQVTTTYLVANAVRALLHHPDQWELLRRAPRLPRGAASELMRFDTSVQFTTRIAVQGFELRGYAVRRGDPVTLLLGSGNRDPGHFPDPDRLDLSRNSTGHLSFGYGAHYCVGAPLALLEIEVVLESIVRRLAGPRIATPRLRWHDSINFRFLTSLPVRFEPETRRGSGLLTKRRYQRCVD
ncbi:MAG: cytochrome P450 [Nocardioidaceae bacterium]